MFSNISKDVAMQPNQVQHGQKTGVSGSESEFYPTLGACSSPTINSGEPLKGKIGSPLQIVLVLYQICEVRGEVLGEKFWGEVVISY